MKCGNFLALNQFALKTKPQHSTQQTHTHTESPTHTHTLTNWNLSLVFCFSLAQQCANNGPEAILSTTTTLIYFTVVDKIIANVRLEVDPAKSRERHTYTAGGRERHSVWESERAEPNRLVALAWSRMGNRLRSLTLTSSSELCFSSVILCSFRKCISIIFTRKSVEWSRCHLSLCSCLCLSVCLCFPTFSSLGLGYKVIYMSFKS